MSKRRRNAAALDAQVREEIAQRNVAFLAARGEPLAFIHSGFSHVDGSSLSAHGGLDTVMLCDGIAVGMHAGDAAMSAPITVQLGLDAADTKRAQKYADMMRAFPSLAGSAFPTHDELITFEPLCAFISMCVHRWPAASVQQMSLAQLVDLVQRPQRRATAAASPYMVAVACVACDIARASTWTVANMGRLSHWMLNACMWDCVLPLTLKVRAASAVTTQNTDDVLMGLLEVARLADMPVTTHGCTALLPYIGAYMDRLYQQRAFAQAPARAVLSRALASLHGMDQAVVFARTSDALDGLCLPVKALVPAPTLLFDASCVMSDAAAIDLTRQQQLLAAEAECYAWMFVCASVCTGHLQLAPFSLAAPWAEHPALLFD
jgi:hypothetical protein